MKHQRSTSPARDRKAYSDSIEHQHTMFSAMKKLRSLASLSAEPATVVELLDRGYAMKKASPCRKPDKANWTTQVRLGNRDGAVCNAGDVLWRKPPGRFIVGYRIASGNGAVGATP